MNDISTEQVIMVITPIVTALGGWVVAKVNTKPTKEDINFENSLDMIKTYKEGFFELKEENRNLMEQIKQLSDENQELKKTIEHLRKEIAELTYIVKGGMKNETE